MAYEFVEEDQPEESLSAGVMRNTARQASNLTTRAIGLPGDFFSLVNEYIANPTVEAFGGKKVPYEETLLGKTIPTTEQHRKGIESITGEYLRPQNEVEKFVDNVIEDTALLLTPGGKGIKATKAIPKSFIKSLGANVAGKGAQDFSGSESVGDYTKAGSLLFLSLIDTPAAAKQLSELYKKAERYLPEGSTTSAKQLTNNIESLKDKITKKRPLSNLAPSEKFVINEIEKIENLVKDGQIDIAQAWAQKRSLNENLQKHLFENFDKGSQQRARKLAKPLNYFLNKTIEQYGKKNQAFYEPFKSAEEGFGTMAQSNFISKWVEKNVRSSPATQGLLHLFGTGIGKVAVTTTTLPVAVAYQASKLGYRIAKSPTLRKIYSQAVKAAGKENTATFTKLLEKLDKELQEEELQDRYIFID